MEGSMLTFTGPANHEVQDSYDVNVVATDGGGLTDTISLTIPVEDDNDDPVIESEIGTLTDAVNEGETVIYTATSSDEDGDTLIYSLSGTDADKMTVDASGVVTLNSAADYEDQPSYDFDLNVFDGTTTTTENIVVNIADVNEAPEITSLRNDYFKLDSSDPVLDASLLYSGWYTDNYVQVDLPALTGEVHVWTQTPDEYLGVIDI